MDTSHLNYPLSMQDCVNEFYKVFIKNKMPKSQGSEYCLYRSNNREHGCAIGILIPDDLYQTSIENVTVYELPKNILDSIMGDNLNKRFLGRLQCIHDSFFRS